MYGGMVWYYPEQAEVAKVDVSKKRYAFAFAQSLIKPAL